MKKLSAIESMFITLNLYPARGFNNPGIRYRIYLLLCLLLVVNACGAENPSVTADVASSVENVKLSDSKSISQDKLQTIADTVYLGGRIYTVDANDSWAQALAIANGKILAVGSDELIRSHISGTTQVVNLDNMMVMPGIHDMHVHPMEAGQKALYQCGFPFTMTLEEIFEKLSECVSETPKGEWILGGQWASQLLESDPVPHKSMLDAVTQDHPVYLGDSTVHSAWLNSRALDLLGIDENTPETKGGVIVREQDTNEPTGILLDKAAYKVLQEIPPYTETEYEDALKWAIGEMNRFGVTTIKDALVDSHALKAYSSLDKAGSLHAKVNTSLGWNTSWTESREKELENIAQRKKYQSENVNTAFIKIMLDGIPRSRTAAMLEPYSPDVKHGREYTGELMHSPEQLTQDIIQLDRQGLTVKLHATGDRSVRVALDAIEAARKANGDSGLMHEISHAQLIHPDDIPRFKALNAIAELSPILWYPTSLTPFLTRTIGEQRASQFWPMKSLHDSGALMIYGSDWPSVVPDPSPWPGMEAMVTRRDPYGRFSGVLGAEHALDLATTIRIFTINGALAGQSGDRTGSIEVGKSADFIVLDRNLFEVPPKKMSDTKVLATIVAGKEIYRGR